MIYFKNTLTGTLDEFKPLQHDIVGMYNCGPTVYGKVHIGNMRAYIFADLIKQVLIRDGYAVHQVINITDVGHLVDDGDDGDDKVETQAKKENLDVKTITLKYTHYFFEQLRLLNIDDSDTMFPKASEHISEQIRMISQLEAKGMTYTTSDGVYFDTAQFPEYGQLGKIDIKGLKEGARIGHNNEKRNPTDFALWKFSTDNRLQEWESPWGIGFPGWHIECSAMAKKYLGTTFDIHTGGVDHIPTHHNNEIAQSQSAHDAPLAHYWMHANHITIDGKKISKSIGNTLYLEDIVERGIHPLSYKFWLYTSHYSTLTNFTFESLEASDKALTKLRSFVTSIDSTGETDESYVQTFNSYIYTDLDTPKAVALMFDLLKDDAVSDQNKRATLLDFDSVLGLDLLNTSLVTIQQDTSIDPVITNLAIRRTKARSLRDFAQADALRHEIELAGYSIKDTDSEDGFVLKKKR